MKNAGYILHQLILDIRQEEIRRDPVDIFSGYTSDCHNSHIIILCCIFDYSRINRHFTNTHLLTLLLRLAVTRINSLEIIVYNNILILQTIEQ